MQHDGVFPEQHHRGTARAVSFLSFVFHLKKSRREDIKQRPCSPVPNNPVLNPGPCLLQAGLQTLLCFPHRSPVCWRTDQLHVFPGDLHVLWGNPSLPQGPVSCLPSTVCPAQRLLHIAAQRTLPAAGAGSRAGTEQRQVPPGIKPHSQLWLHMLPHQHQPLVTNWLCCPEWEVGSGPGFNPSTPVAGRVRAATVACSQPCPHPCTASGFSSEVPYRNMVATSPVISAFPWKESLAVAWHPEILSSSVLVCEALCHWRGAEEGQYWLEGLCLAGLPWAQHVVSAHHSWFSGLCPHYPGPPSILLWVQL